MNIASGDPITPKPHYENTPTTLGIGELSWRVYPVETIIAEKLHSLVSLGADNSRSKDIFDLAFYLPSAKTDLLKQAITQTFKYRKESVPNSIALKVAMMDYALLRRGWRSATGAIRPAPDFEWLERHSL